MTGRPVRTRAWARKLCRNGARPRPTRGHRRGPRRSRTLRAPKVNDLYTRKSTHIVERIRRMQRINEIAIVIGAPVVWVLYAALGMPYGGAILCLAWVGLIVVRRQFPHVSTFDAPVSLDSYQYLRAFQRWLRTRLAWGRRVQRHIYAVTFLAIAIAVGESGVGQALIRTMVETVPDAHLIKGIPLIVILPVVAMTIMVDLLGGIIFDFDVSTVYRRVFERLDQMLAEMEELRR